MPRAGAMWFAELSALLEELGVESSARFLFMQLFLHPDLDAGGFLAWQPRVMASLTGLQVDRVEQAVGHLEDKGLVVVDRQKEKLWVKPFLEYDTSRKPNMYIAAMRAVREVGSRKLKGAAWQEIQRIHPPFLKFDPKKPEVHQKQVEDRDAAYADLKNRIDREGIVGEPFPNSSRTVPEPPFVIEPVREERVGTPKPPEPQQRNDTTARCSKCRERPATGGQIAWRPELCRPCASTEKAFENRAPSDWGAR